MDIKFKDIEAVIKALAYGETRPTNANSIAEWDAANEGAHSALWKIREHLVLDDDYGLTQETRMKLKNKSLTEKARKWNELDEEISEYYRDEFNEDEDEEYGDGLIGIGELAARAFGYL